MEVIDKFIRIVFIIIYLMRYKKECFKCKKNRNKPTAIMLLSWYL
jgi:hypothetical protein